MDLNRIPTGSDVDDTAPLSAVISDASTVSTSRAPPAVTRSTSSRLVSTHSLLAANNAPELRRGAQPETNRTSMDRPSISMPPPSSKPAAERRLSQSLASAISGRRSEDLARSPPTSVNSDDRQLTTSPKSSTTATDTTSVTAKSHMPAMNGAPTLSPPPVLPMGADTMSVHSSQAPSPGETKSERTSVKDLGSQITSLMSSGKPEASLSETALPTRAPRPAKPRSISSSRRFSGTGSKTEVDEVESQPPVGKIGVCALDIKARSRPSRQILTRLQGNGEFEVIVFGDKVILDEAVENWPICDFLISFFSDGFPLDKAIAYWKMRKPFLVNDLMMQKVLWDRRLCLQILDNMKVPTPQRMEVTRDGGPRLESPDLAQHVKTMSGVILPGPDDGTGGGAARTENVYMADPDTLIIDGKVLKKPFVEKPVSGEDHNVIIYFHSSEGGGARRLFRKVGNKSSELDADLVIPRCIEEPDSSYLYEQFLKVENSEDVKAYTVGTEYCHAETRKSPVVDGLVRRNLHGKELRYVTKLSDEERKMAARVARGFGQRICGFDLLRTGTNSYVIDVNGWSFVKDNEAYYNDCANILRSLFFSTKFKSDFGTEDPSPIDTPPEGVSIKQPHSHRHVLKKILKSPSMSKLSAHIPHSTHHGSGTASPRHGSTTVPISSPPSLERHNVAVSSLPNIDKGIVLPPPVEGPSPGTVGSTSTPDVLPISTSGEQTEQAIPMPSSKHSWKLKGVVTVIRHADRTPKQKIKFTAHSQIFVDLLKGHNEEVLLKGPAALASVENAVKIAMQQKLEDPEKLRNLRNALARKGGQPDTKVQIKPMFRKRKPEEMQSLSPIITNGMQTISESPTRIEPLPSHDGTMPTPSDLVTVERSDSVSGITFSRFAAVENDLVLDKLQLVMKWGGEPTHSARYQSHDLGANMRDDYMLMNREVLEDVHIFTSSEKRVRTSAQIFAASFLNRQELPDDFISVRKDLLDDSNAAKDVMDKVKKKLKHLLREGNSVPEEFAWPKDVNEPYVVMQRVVDLLKFHRRVMRHNFKKIGSGAAASLAAINATDDMKEEKNIDVATIQARWCTGEDAELFKERWEKLFSEFCDSEKADPSKISELYDTMKYDALHNKQFLEWVFTPSQTVIDEIRREEAVFFASVSPSSERADEPVQGYERSDSVSTAAASVSEGKHSFAHKLGLRRRSVLTQPPSTPPLASSEQDVSYFKLFSGTGDSRSKIDKRLGRLRELYRLAKILFDYIGPQEYGISNDEKLEIGLLTSLPLLREIVQDLEELQAGDAQSFVYFTKESHIYTLLNCIMEGGIHTKIKRSAIPELDYLSQICFELYEARDSETEKSTYSIRISVSPGCHSVDPLDVSLDSKHAIGSAPRRSLTDHQDWQEVISTLKAKFNSVQLPKSFLAINVSDKHEQEAEEAQAKAEVRRAVSSIGVEEDQVL